MTSPTETILAHLDAVNRQRALRASDPALASHAAAVRRFQTERFRTTYQDLLAREPTRAAAGFFLEELYGVHDFVDRDAQFRRIVPAIVRLFSADVVQTVTWLAELHGLSERLDTEMARALPAAGSPPVEAEAYGEAWRRVGQPEARERQIALVGQIGRALIRYTRHPALGKALRVMRLPARAAGLHALQAFLERGFDTFGALSDPEAFIETILSRERAIAGKLFDGA